MGATEHFTDLGGDPGPASKTTREKDLQDFNSNQLGMLIRYLGTLRGWCERGGENRAHVEATLEIAYNVREIIIRDNAKG